eukprot:CAMPEP_0183333332 /NCGR_PEP_ID=MMETSP0164_2-20130417/2254_1 /TAXON_ID=221442 /ORGANISM="Coccolithus pelagicus ssp braarudi, Strain PLY182g" /LENGTH=89 /DNA_ID=CAMNT_0025502233 /DNA_START=480 /DNA_END=749 /DNA_ORIENTATION=+
MATRQTPRLARVLDTTHMSRRAHAQMRSTYIQYSATHTPPNPHDTLLTWILALRQKRPGRGQDAARRRPGGPRTADMARPAADMARPWR